MADGAPYVSPRPALRLNGTPNDDMLGALIDVAVRAPENGMASAEVREIYMGIAA